MPKRLLLFGLLTVACTLGVAAAVASAVLGGDGAVKSSAGGDGTLDGLLFRSLDPAGGPKDFDALGSTSTERPEPGGRTAGPACARVHASRRAALCLAQGGNLTTAYRALVLDASLRVRREVPLAGVPSRARVSRDGRYGATTTFVTGHSYAEPGAFSTQALIIDMARGAVVADLESFELTRRDGTRVDAPDVNFWGITFARDSDRFYATVATGGKTHLMEGSVSRRRATVLNDNVECPSLSPDETRIGYKKLVGDAWRLHVLDLASGEETALAETAPIDDQVEWLDDGHVLYRKGQEIWTARADGTGAPRRFLARADSPAVVR